MRLSTDTEKPVPALYRRVHILSSVRLSSAMVIHFLGFSHTRPISGSTPIRSKTWYDNVSSMSFWRFNSLQTVRLV